MCKIKYAGDISIVSLMHIDTQKILILTIVLTVLSSTNQITAGVPCSLEYLRGFQWANVQAGGNAWHGRRVAVGLDCRLLSGREPFTTQG